MSDERAVATVTITKTTTDDDELIYVDALTVDGEDDLSLLETLGMIEMAKSVLLASE